MTQQWYVEHDDGSIEQVYSDTKPDPKARKIDRFGDLAIERHHAKKGWTAREAEHLHAAIDAGHDADHGWHRRQLDRIAKEMEARIILAGVPIEGRVSREAQERGIAVEELARQIVANADAADVEGERVRRKLAHK
jgi:hypothetical protein